MPGGSPDDYPPAWRGVRRAAADPARWLLLLGAGACAPLPARPAVLAADAADGGRTGAADAVAPAELPTYRACGHDGRDPEGGFCDATARWGVRVSVATTGDIDAARGGVTVADFDGDGHLDLFVTASSDVPPVLLLHRGGAWVDAAAAWGLGDLRETLPSAAADLDGDGDPDLVVGFLGGSAVRVFRNEGTRFVEATAPLGDPEEVAAVVPVDLDRDGRLDLLVAALSHPGACLAGLVAGCPSGVRAYRQTAAWTFEAMPVDAPPRRAQALRVADWDGDGRDEVLVGADFGMFDGGNLVLRVRPAPGGGFALADATAGTGFDQRIFAMGIGALDVDGDGRDEFLVTNFGRNVLLTRAGGRAADVALALGADACGTVVPGGAPRFRDFDPGNAREGPLGAFQARYLDRASPVTPTTKWAPLVFDADDDGIADVYVPAGAIGLADVYPEGSPQASTLLRGTGRRLEDVTVAMHASDRRDANAAVAADLDEDGDLDLVVFHIARPGRPGGLSILRNDASAGRSLTVVARGRGAARDGIGAVVEVTVGGRVVRQRLDGNLSVFGSGPHEVHLGLGAAPMADAVTVRFPSGATVRRGPVPAGRVVVEE